MQPFGPILNNVFGAGIGVEFLAALHFGVNGRKKTFNRRFVEVGDNIDAVG